MADDDPENRTFLHKLLFYTTAFFVLLGIFSLFASLFLVPFVIEPAFTTIFMEFDPVAALCQTMDREQRFGVSNCTWSSCREGCTKEVFACTQLRVNYKLVDPPPPMSTTSPAQEEHTEESGAEEDEESLGSLDGTRWDRRKSRDLRRRSRSSTTAEYDLGSTTTTAHSLLYRNVSTRGPDRKPRATKDYDYFEEDVSNMKEKPDGDLDASIATGLAGNNSEWFYIGAQFFPNVKGCGYPPMLNCTIWLKKYETPGTNFSCYYSKIDPSQVISDLDMHQVFMNLVFAIAIPVPSFIISVIYMTIAYFKIYNEEEAEALVPAEDTTAAELEVDVGTPVPALTPGSEAFREDLASFGHQLKVAMADEMSRESIADSVPAALNNSNSISGNMTKTMTTSISTPPGPIAAV